MDSLLTDHRHWSRKDVAELLCSRNALTELTLDQALQIVQRLAPQRVKSGTVLIREGVTATSYMALILQGEAVVENDVRGSSESMVVTVLGTGHLFGELGVLDGKPRSATITAVTDMDIAVLDRTAVHSLIEQSPAVACSLMAAMMTRMSERLRATNAKVKTLTAINRSLLEELAQARQTVDSAQPPDSSANDATPDPTAHDGPATFPGRQPPGFENTYLKST